MASTAISRVKEPEGRPIARRLLGLAPLFITAGVIGLMWLRVERQDAELRRTRLALESAVNAERAEQPAVSLAFAKEFANLARARSPVANPEAPSEVSPPPADPELVVEQEPSPEQRAQLRKARFDHIDGIFNAQTSADFQPERARALESAVAPALSVLAKRSDLQLGSLQCRGRMCAVDVAFDDVGEVEVLDNAVAAELRGKKLDKPLVHIVTRAGDQGKHNVGRMYFEWRPAVAP